MSELEMPLDMKNSILGRKVCSGSDRRHCGNCLVKRRIWDSENPSFFKESITKSGFSRVSKVRYLEAEAASWGEKPQVSTRYETVKESPLDEIELQYLTVEGEVIPKFGDYIMAYSIGTSPSFETAGTLDTGSDLIWPKCDPCKECFDPI
ncbi:hypothetical protein K1719_042179 [Acacia pycnantha]|nr:hypothetical protein K1719_042179 [Acacia pycnantha]